MSDSDPPNPGFEGEDHGNEYADTPVSPGSEKVRESRVASTRRVRGKRQRRKANELTIHDIASKLRSMLAIIRNRWLSGMVAALIVSSFFAYMFYKEVPEHTAVSTMIAQSPMDDVLRSDGGAPQRKEIVENSLQNHLSVMKSRRFSLAVANEFTHKERLRIVEPFMMAGREPTMSSFEKMLAGRMDATRQRDREFFTLSFRHPDAEIAVMVADRMTSTYLKLVQQEIRETNQAAAEVLRAQADQLQSEISDLEERQREFREKNSIVSLHENNDLLAERLSRLEQKRDEAKIDRYVLETRLNEAREDLEDGNMPFDNPYLANYANNDKLRVELDQLLAKKEVMALRYGKNHPKMRDADQRISVVEDNLNRNFSIALKNLEGEYQAAETLESQLVEEYREKFQESFKVARVADQFLVIGEEVDAKRKALSDILIRVNEADVKSRLPVDVMRVVDPAFIAKPKLARRKLAAVFGALLASGAFVIVPLGMQLFDQRLKCAIDVEEELGKPLLGGIHKLHGIKKAERPHIVSNNKDPRAVEPFMSIVAQLELVSIQEGTKSFVVTSTTSGEGKSTISANLAAGFAQIRRKTLLVDGDLRGPCLHQFYRAKKPGGILRWAEAGYPEADIFSDNSMLGIQQLSNGVYLLPAGGLFPLPTQLLVSPSVKTLFEELEKHFEVIIVDTPPASLYPDAFVFAKSIGETILVARESKAPIAQIRRVITDMDETAAPVVGVVMNDYSQGSLNPLLAYNKKGHYRYVNALVKQNEKKKPVSSSSLITKLMTVDSPEAEEGGTESELATVGRKKPVGRSFLKKKKDGASPKGGLISRAMEENEEKDD